MVWLLISQGMKNCKITESFCLSMLTINTNDWFFFWHVYWAAIFIFCKIPICASLEHYSLFLRAGKGLTSLPSWLGIVNGGWLGSMRSKFFLQMKFIFFKAVRPDRLPFYLGSPLHIMNSLFTQFCSFQNDVLLKMFKLGYWNFKLIFLRMQFSLVSTFSL